MVVIFIFVQKSPDRFPRPALLFLNKKIESEGLLESGPNGAVLRFLLCFGRFLATLANLATLTGVKMGSWGGPTPSWGWSVK